MQQQRRQVGQREPAAASAARSVTLPSTESTNRLRQQHRGEVLALRATLALQQILAAHVVVKVGG